MSVVRFSVVPAGIGLLKGGPNPEMAKAFICFLLSEVGQKLLFEPQISRLRSGNRFCTLIATSDPWRQLPSENRPLGEQLGRRERPSRSRLALRCPAEVRRFLFHALLGASLLARARVTGRERARARREEVAKRRRDVRGERVRA